MRPVPQRPWVLKQSWNDLLFAHWPVAQDRLRELVPRYLELDTYESQAWVSVTPFRLTDMSPRGLPALPWISSFNEINVRTYVTYEGVPGIYFFSLDADSVIAVKGARAVFHLPYFLAEMTSGVSQSRLAFASRRSSEDLAEFQAEFGPVGPPFAPAPGTLDHWLTERYCLYTHSSRSHVYRVSIDHEPWQLHEAEADITTNTMAERAAIRLPSIAPLLHFAHRQDVVTWAPEQLI
jgi:hypothetical protein